MFRLVCVMKPAFLTVSEKASKFCLDDETELLTHDMKG